MKEAKTWTPSKTQGLYKHVSGTYYARVSIAGKETWRTLKTKLYEIAKVEFKKLKEDVEHKNEVAKETNLDEHLTGAIALAIRILQIENSPGVKPSTRKYWGQIVAAFKKSWPEFLSAELRKITEQDCLLWVSKYQKMEVVSKAKQKPGMATLEKQVKNRSATRFNNTLGLLNSLFQIAIDSGARRTNPAAKLKRLKPRQKDLSGRLPSRAKFAEWVAAIRKIPSRHSQHTGDFVELLAYTGVRKGEGACIEWRHCDFEREMLTVLGTEEDGTKNGEIRYVPMIPSAKELLQRMRSDRSEEPETALALKVHEAQKSMDNAGKKVGIPRITHHDLRHLFATVCIESNVDVPSVSKWLGHKDGGALAMKTYAHLRKDHSLASAKKVTFAA